MSDEKSKEPDPNAWMVTFGDLIMLLLTFFVLLLTMKSMDRKQTEEMFEHFINAEETEWDFGFRKTDEHRLVPDADGQQKSFISSSAMLKKTLKKDFYNFRKNFEISEDSRGIVVTIDSENLFESGKAAIKVSGFDKLNVVGDMLKNIANDILILGHTDNVPLRTGPFRSNWDLSCYRALNVFQYFVQEFGLPQGNMAPGGYGATRPIMPNNSPVNRAKNRRIEIILRT